MTPPPKRHAKPSKKPAIQVRVERLYLMVSKLQQRLDVRDREIAEFERAMGFRKK